MNISSASVTVDTYRRLTLSLPNYPTTHVSHSEGHFCLHTTHSFHQLHMSHSDGHLSVHTTHRGLTLSLPQYPPTSRHKMRGTFVYTPHRWLTISLPRYPTTYSSHNVGQFSNFHYHSIYQLHMSHSEGQSAVHTTHRGLTLSLPQYLPTSHVTQ